MLNVDLLAPILLTRAALPSLRASGDAMVVNVTSGIALIGVPFYATYAAAEAGLARFGEALRRELKGEGIHVLTVYPGGTDTPMMKTNRVVLNSGLVVSLRPRSRTPRSTASRRTRSRSSGASKLAPR
jgi:short-subunit dehydrogenase